MGGFRCSYRNCNLGVATDEKIRYFHFPIKDRKRCEQWIINTQKAHFHTLPIEKLRNKVVCQYHFEPKCFTNARHDRLTYCAIPTLDPTAIKLSLNDVQVVPIEATQNDSFAVVTSKNERLKNPPSQAITNTLDLTKTSTLDELSLIPVSRDKCTFRISSSPPVKKVKVNVKNIVTPNRLPMTSDHDITRLQSNVNDNSDELSRINNDDSADNYEYATIVPMETQESNNFTYTVTETGELNLISNPSKSKPKVPLSVNNIKLEQLSGDSYSICIDSSDSQSSTTTTATTNDKRAEFVSPQKDAVETVETVVEEENTNKNDEFIHYVTENTKHEQQLKSKVAEQQMTRNELKRKRNNRREIIFKHLSKEINPVLATALKMELFRHLEWDDSEKHLAMSLYGSTPDGYRILVDQWGFKLPPEELVKNWLEEEENVQQIDEEEDDLDMEDKHEEILG